MDAYRAIHEQHPGVSESEAILVYMDVSQNQDVSDEVRAATDVCVIAIIKEVFP